ncbi:hypothetical protein BZA05DRAFT_115564 [Tricharina praecox]|uniref:uncharacterized protein n=1 Tax=Tricharina praecox TaxID=43433 RepID=UPI002220C147|nr:uncharacterized protein BZA05DRAFT_115564 [Tricharina praecox]KAI5858108.1 hypothetical protein BZA05DRAFT_115564 [Tricharina praecox]
MSCFFQSHPHFFSQFFSMHPIFGILWHTIPSPVLSLYFPPELYLGWNIFFFSFVFLRFLFIWFGILLSCVLVFLCFDFIAVLFFFFELLYLCMYDSAVCCAAACSCCVIVLFFLLAALLYSSFCAVLLLDTCYLLLRRNDHSIWTGLDRGWTGCLR